MLPSGTLPMRPKLYVAYYRASTPRQGRSGLGLEAQQVAVQRYLRDHAGEVIAEIIEVESGRRNDRPKFAEALWLCRVYEARLVIARLDRLARNVALIAKLLESGVDFVAADMPLANRFTIHILAAVAEYESKLKSERITAAYAVARAKGQVRKVGQDPNYREHLRRGGPASATASRQRAKARALDMAPLICEMRDGGKSIAAIAAQLSAMEVGTPGRGRKWSWRTVQRMFDYLGESRPALARGGRRKGHHTSSRFPPLGNRILMARGKT